ncbi:MAG: metallophosphoesterase family protein [Gammaproteobacteria bacterium]|nr:metallophosphoesterase family protein [Gammaproteobacteria bacterium]
MDDDQAQESLEVIGSIVASDAISKEDIARAISGQSRALAHGQEFTGRPTTKITVYEEFVVKWRVEYKFNRLDTGRWIERTLERERRYKVHHPAKTWFFVRQGENFLIANITPKLLPLHIAQQQHSPSKMLEHFEALAELYFQTAANFKVKLDEGLSNFGLDDHGRLYYLDDDLYNWDQFTSLALIVGVWCRQLSWLTPELAQQLGSHMRQSLLEHFPDTHWVSVISRQINALFFANEAQIQRKEHFLASFNGHVKRSMVRKSIRDKRIGVKRFAILADIHANYPALQAVLRCMDEWDVKDAVILGDTVGYGPHPQECIRALQARDFLVLKGNHDHALVAGVPTRGFSALGRWVLEWSVQQLEQRDRDWLAELPVIHQQEQWLAVHGAPLDKTFFNAYVYQMTFEENLNYLAEQNIPVCLHGHSHIQGVYFRRGKRQGFSDDAELFLEPVSHCLVCPGSVGQPRSGKVGAEFAVFDGEESVIRFYRVNYEIEVTIKDMQHNGFPNQLIDRLRKGQ